MSRYECQQCKETSELPFVGGACSKCGSLNIKNLEKLTRPKKSKQQETSKKSFLMILLWGYIFYELWKRIS
jgi:predicted ATP-dependent serine protease